MDWLEEELKRALARPDAPPGFDARVLRRVERRPAHAGARRWLALAASLTVIAGSTVAWREHRGAVAKREVMTALRITADKLNHIQARVKEVRP
jgi:hypothetical protein